MPDGGDGYLITSVCIEREDTGLYYVVLANLCYYYFIRLHISLVVSVCPGTIQD